MSLSDNLPNWFNFDPYCVIASKWGPNLIKKLIISGPKSVSSTHSVDKTKKQYEFNVSLQPPRFTIYSRIFTNDLSIWEILTDDLSTYGLTYL